MLNRGLTVYATDRQILKKIAEIIDMNNPRKLILDLLKNGIRNFFKTSPTIAIKMFLTRF